MKNILLILAFVFGVQASSQTIDTIVTIDTTTTIDTLTTIDTVMLINKTDSSVVSIPISEIDSVTFDDDTTTNYNYTYTYDTTVTYDTSWVSNNGCNGLTSLTYNGYTYDLVEIGNQCWFAENLRTKTYLDGTSIDYPGTDNILWENNTTGAYAWYDNDSTAYDSIYGMLYNWYAVDNSAGLCPTGWHVPTDSTWAVLDSFLAQNGFNYDGSTTGNKYAKAMADTVGWSSDTGTGSIGNSDYPTYRNKSGFSALPGGFRYKSGSYFNIVTSGSWASSSQSNAIYVWGRSLHHSSSYISVSNGNKKDGVSVRCIKD